MDRTEIGKRGEDAAAAYLERIGMTVETRNWSCRSGEIDIIARDGDALVFIEVKTRRSERAGSAEESVSQNKQRRLAKLAAEYLSTGVTMPAGGCRFDVVGIRVIAEDRALLRHHRGAFEVSR